MSGAILLPSRWGRSNQPAVFQARISCWPHSAVVAWAMRAGAAAGFPLTHRGVTMAVTFLTGHCADGRQSDLRPFVATGATLCLYMGAKHLVSTAAGLLAAGQSPATPVALVSRASQPDESLRVVELHELASGQVDTASLPTPLMTVVGEVVRQPGWRDRLT